MIKASRLKNSSHKSHSSDLPHFSFSSLFILKLLATGTTFKMALSDIIPPGVVTGDNLMKLMEHARDNGYAIPAVNVTR